MRDHENEAANSLLNLKDPSTTKDKQMNSTLYLKETSARLFGVHEELSRLHSICCDESISTRNKISALLFLGKTIIPFVKETSIKLSEASKFFLLFPAWNMYIRNMKPNKKKYRKL